MMCEIEKVQHFKLMNDKLRLFIGYEKMSNYPKRYNQPYRLID